MIYEDEATRAECIFMRAELERHRLTPKQMTPRGRIVGVIQTDSLRVFAIVCRPDTMDLEQYDLGTMQDIVAPAEANAAGEEDACASF